MNRYTELWESLQGNHMFSMGPDFFGHNDGLVS